MPSRAVIRDTESCLCELHFKLSFLVVASTEKYCNCVHGIVMHGDMPVAVGPPGPGWHAMAEAVRFRTIHRIRLQHPRLKCGPGVVYYVPCGGMCCLVLAICRH